MIGELRKADWGDCVVRRRCPLLATGWTR